MDDIDLVRRALVLRRRGVLGVLWVECGAFYVAQDVVDPYGSRRRYSSEQFAELLAELEGVEAPSKPAGSERFSGATKKYFR